MRQETLSLKKPSVADSVPASPKKIRFEDSLLGKPLILFTKNHGIEIHGTITAIDGGWFEIDGIQYRHLVDGSLSAAMMSGRFIVDRSSITSFCEVA